MLMLLVMTSYLSISLSPIITSHCFSVVLLFCLCTTMYVDNEDKVLSMSHGDFHNHATSLKPKLIVGIDNSVLSTSIVFFKFVLSLNNPHNTTPLILRWLYVVTWVGATLTVNVAPTELWPLAHRWSYRCGNVVAT